MAQAQNSNGGTTKPAAKRTRTPRSPKSPADVAQHVRTTVSRHLLDIGVDHERAPEIMASLRNLTTAIHPDGARGSTAQPAVAASAAPTTK